MRLPSTRRSLIAAAVVVVAIPVAYVLARPPQTPDASVVAQAKRGEFKVIVTTSGELRAIKYVHINVPQNAQQANHYQMKSSSIVPEGTVVKEGDVVAELDRSGIASRASDVGLALQIQELLGGQAESRAAVVVRGLEPNDRIDRVVPAVHAEVHQPREQTGHDVVVGVVPAANVDVEPGDG